MKKLILTVMAVMVLLTAVNASAAVKIRDLADVQGIRDNQLFGYGLVVGLNGSGDKQQTEFTVQSLVNMLDRMGITVPQGDVKVKSRLPRRDRGKGKRGS